MRKIPGTELVCELLDGYDERTKLAYYAPLKTIVVAHPDFPPALLKDGKLIPIEVQHG